MAVQMPKLDEGLAEWVDDVPQINDGMPPTGGPVDLANDKGVANAQAQVLGRRSLWLRAQVEAILAQVAGQDFVTTADLQQAIDGLLNGASGAFDTLQELADALGNDANFSATVLQEIGDLKTPVVAAIPDDAILDAINASSVWTVAQGVLSPPLAIGGTIEHTEFSDGSAVQKAYRLTPSGIFLTKHIRTRRTGTWSDWTADGPDIGDLVIQTHSSTLLDRLEASGADLNRTSYADLFDRTGTTYGVGDGATTFGTLDARGEFLRGWDNGRGVDAGRALGSFQQGTHITADDSIAPAVQSPGLITQINVDPPDALARTIYSISAQLAGSYSGSQYWGRTRPRNIAQMFCIKF